MGKSYCEFCNDFVEYEKRMVREKRIIAYKVGRQYIVKEQDLNNYLDSVKYER